MTRSAEHVAAIPDAFECLHCGARHEPDVPMPLEVLITQARGFLLMHRLCPKPEAPSRQMALPGTGADPAAPWVPYEPPEATFKGIDGSTDEPAPEIDPPVPYAVFNQRYPIAYSWVDLYSTLHDVLNEKQWNALPGICPWEPDTGIFNAVANWARIEKAHADAGKRDPIAGLTLPRREPMPEKLAELLGVKPTQKKGARPLVNPKRKGKTATP